MFVTGLVISYRKAGPMDVLVFLLSAMVFVICLYPLFKIGVLGAGDVKLYGVCAGYLPEKKVLYFLFCSLLVAAIFSLIKLLVERNVRERLQYFAEYIMDVARSGQWRLYMENEREYRRTGVCLAGPILCSVILYMGGVY